jgi:hypothetical protein
MGQGKSTCTFSTERLPLSAPLPACWLYAESGTLWKTYTLIYPDPPLGLGKSTYTFSAERLLLSAPLPACWLYGESRMLRKMYMLIYPDPFLIKIVGNDVLFFILNANRNCKVGFAK